MSSPAQEGVRDPGHSYQVRQAYWQEEAATLQRSFLRLGNWRLAIAVLTVVIAYLIWGRSALPTWTILVPVACFVALAIRHQSVIRSRTLAQRALRFYEDGLKRLAGNWSEEGSLGERFQNPDHVYADDLDVFGKGSLFQFVSRARTAAGEDRLASWLLAPGTPTEVLGRQTTVQELFPRLQLREEIALLGDDVRSEVKPDVIARWAAKPAHAIRSARIVTFVLGCLGVAAVLGFFGQLLPFWVLALFVGANLLTSFLLRERIDGIAEGIETPSRDVLLLSQMLGRLEKEQFESQYGQRLRELLRTEGSPASASIRSLSRRSDLFDSRDHLFVRVLQPVLLWKEQTALSVEQWRIQHRQSIDNWLLAIAEFEALSSLAALAFERPDWTVPSFQRDKDAHFAAVAIRHPLLPPDRCIPNDIAFDSPLRLWIISGSNMSGKSTLLRAIGLNTVLAAAGAPVAAQSMSLSDLQVGASLRVSDSLQDNRSRFMAEIVRLRDIVNLTRAGGRPVLFLLDELLSGTNSHDRRIGSSSIVKGLVEKGAIGLLTTHDLALTEIQADLGERARNAHFQDEVLEGQVQFDYRLRPGIVTRSNAIALMRMIGLDV